jgi:NAD(P)-dependent dehydrogenase (short-subunit alcohol dehydrogenase family)
MRRVLVTGGGSGIGRAIAKAFAADGCEVTISGRRLEALQQTSADHAMDCRVADITDEDSVAALFDRPYHVVVANAGVALPNRLRNTSLADWNQMIATNLTGTFLTFRAGLEGMEPGGRLIAIASTAALQGGPMVAGYAASKHGVLGLVRSVAKEVAKSGITCNAVCPGYVDTDMAQAGIEGLMKKQGIDRDAATAKIVGGNPTGRLISTDEVVAAVRFLASAEASMVNGHALSISGGEL